MADNKAYDEKVKKLERYIPFLSDVIVKNKASNNPSKEKLAKLEAIYDILTFKKRTPYQTIDKIEKIILSLISKNAESKTEVKIENEVKVENEKKISTKNIKVESDDSGNGRSKYDDNRQQPRIKVETKREDVVVNRSRDRHREKSKEQRPKNTSKDRSDDRNKSKERSQDRFRDTSYGRSGDLSRNRSPPVRSRGRSRDNNSKDRSDDRNKSRERSQDRSRDTSRDLSRGRSPVRSRGRSRDNSSDRELFQRRSTEHKNDPHWYNRTNNFDKFDRFDKNKTSFNSSRFPDKSDSKGSYNPFKWNKVEIKKERIDNKYEHERYDKVDSVKGSSTNFVPNPLYRKIHDPANSVFNRLGSKIKPDSYQNFKVNVTNNIIKNKHRSESPEKLTSEDIADIEAQNELRTGKKKPIDIDAKNLEELKSLKRVLESKIKKDTTYLIVEKDTGDDVRKPIPEIKETQQNDLSHKIKEMSKKSSSTTISTVSPFNKPKEKNIPETIVRPMRKNESDVSVLNKPDAEKEKTNATPVKSIVPETDCDSIYELVKKAIATTINNKPESSVSPTVARAIEKVVPFAESIINPERPLNVCSTEPINNNAFDIQPKKPTDQTTDTIRLAYKYKTKPKRPTDDLGSELNNTAIIAPRFKNDANCLVASPPPSVPTITSTYQLPTVSYNDPRLRNRDPRLHTEPLHQQPFLANVSSFSSNINNPTYNSSFANKQTASAIPVITNMTSQPVHLNPVHHTNASPYATPKALQVPPFPIGSVPNHPPPHHHHQQPSIISPQHGQSMPNQFNQFSPKSPENGRYGHPNAYNNFSDMPNANAHIKFQPSMNDNVERQKYEQSRKNRYNWQNDQYIENTTAPQTYGEYKRSKQLLQASQSSPDKSSYNSSVPEEVPQEPETEPINKSATASQSLPKSQFDNVYRTGNYSTPIAKTSNAAQKFKIPKIPKVDSNKIDKKIEEENVKKVSLNNKVASSDEEDVNRNDINNEHNEIKNISRKSKRIVSSSESEEDNEPIEHTNEVTDDVQHNKEDELFEKVKSTTAEESSNQPTVKEIPSNSTDNLNETHLDNTLPEPVDITPTNSKPMVEDKSVEDKPEKEEITKEWLEGFLLNMFNPSSSNKNGLLGMLSKVLDENKFTQIKKIIDCPDEKTATTNDDEVTPAPSEPVNKEMIPNDAASVSSVESIGPTRAKPKKKLNELQKLNEDIRTMFISDGVLTATGRRMCTMLKNEKPVSKSKKGKATAKEPIESDASDQPERILRRRKSIAAPEVPATEENISPPAIRLLRNRKSANNETTMEEVIEKVAVAKKETKTQQVKNKRKAIAIIASAASVKKRKSAGRKSTSNVEDESADEKGSDNEEEHNLIDTRLRVRPSTNDKNPKQIKIILEKVLDVPKKLAKRRKHSVSREKDNSTDNVEVKEEEEASQPKKKKPSKDNKESSVNTHVSRRKRKTQINILKNTDIKMHCMDPEYNHKCLLCTFKSKKGVVFHYVKSHPNSEIYNCRLTPSMSDKLRDPNYKPEGSVVYRGATRFMRQKCYFCQVEKQCIRQGWLDHFTIHSGEYQYKCSDCDYRTSHKSKKSSHNCSGTAEHVKNDIPVTNASRNIEAYMCDLCNYIQCAEMNITNHLKNQHGETEIDNKYKKVILLDVNHYYGEKRKSKADKSDVNAEDTKDENVEQDDMAVDEDDQQDADEDIDEDDANDDDDEVEQEEDASDDDQDEEDTELNKSNCVTPPPSSEKIISNPDAFLTPGKDYEGLFNDDTMNLMKNMSYNTTSSESESPESIQRKTSIADRLSKRFKSAQEDETLRSKLDATNTVSSDDIMSMDPLKLEDEEIPIILKEPPQDENDESRETPSTSKTAIEYSSKDDTDTKSVKSDVDSVVSDRVSQITENLDTMSTISAIQSSKSDISEDVDTHSNASNHDKPDIMSDRTSSVVEDDRIVESETIQKENVTDNVNNGDAEDEENEENVDDNEWESCTSEDSENDETSSIPSSTLSSKSLNKSNNLEISRLYKSLSQQKLGGTSNKVVSGNKDISSKVGGERTHHKKRKDKSAVVVVKQENDDASEDQKPDIAQLEAETNKESDKTIEQSSPSTETAVVETDEAAAEKPVELEQSTGSKAEDDKIDDSSKTNTDRAKLTFEEIVREATKTDDVSDMLRSTLNIQNFNNQNRSNMFQNPYIQPKSFTNGGSNGLDVASNNGREKVIYRIENIGYSKCEGLTEFCCLIGTCGFASSQLEHLLSHIDVHSENMWSGYCYMCSEQLFDHDKLLMMEFKHMNEYHLDKDKQEEENSSFGKMPQISIRRLSGDKLSTNKEVTQIQPKQITSIVPIPKNMQNPEFTIVSVNSLASPAASSQQSAESGFLKISNVTGSGALVSPRKQDNNCIVISNVVSLNSDQTMTPSIIGTNLKPWTKCQPNKSKTNCDKMLLDICLFSLYKCMGSNCFFSTNDADLMLSHLRNHDKYLEVQIEQDMSAIDTTSWLECPYCEEMADTCNWLVKHVQEEHSSSIFQCPYCFYRSCAAHNIIKHIQMHHTADPFVFVCTGKVKFIKQELPYVFKCRDENIRSLNCADDSCNKKAYFVMETFVQHLMSSPHHKETFKCQYCHLQIMKTLAAKHMSTHGIGIFECVYCYYGTNEVDFIRKHMCDNHPSKLLYVCVRLMRKDKNKSEIDISSADSTVLAHIGQQVDKKLFHRCPYDNMQLNFMSPSLKANDINTMDPTVAIPMSSTTTPSFRPSSNYNSTIEIVGVNSISADIFNSSEQDSRSLSTNNVDSIYNNVVNFADLEKNYQDYDQYFLSMDSSVGNKQLQQQQQPRAPPKIRPVKNAVATSTSTVVAPISILAAFSVAASNSTSSTSTVASTSTAPLTSTGPSTSTGPPTAATPLSPTSVAAATPRSDLLQNEIDEAAYALVKGTGLEGSELYRCGFVGCDVGGTDALQFNVHLLKHANSGEQGFKCFHCSLVSKNIVSLKYHIKVHGIHRYLCYYCDFSGSIMSHTLKHMNDTHKKMHLVTIALNAKKKDQNKDLFVIAPRGLKQEELNRFGLKLLDRYKHKMSTTKKFYSADEIDLLPRQSIFNESISCSDCHYSTKVRTNMFRHLLMHKNKTNVPLSDPVNPAPCLDTGTKHFDNMINLAGSSNDGRPKAATVTIQSNPYDPLAYVSRLHRYVCNAKGCRYQTINDNMLKCHLNTLHTQERDYKCPHCNVVINPGPLNTVKIIDHLRMHDTPLFKCPKCPTHHFLKKNIEAHVDIIHHGCTETILQIDRNESSCQPNSSNTTQTAQPIPPKWKCAVCNEICTTRPQMQLHVRHAHSITYQYQCEICHEVNSNNKLLITEHMTNKHPNCEKRVKFFFHKVDGSVENDTTPIWRRDDPNKIKHIRGILFEDEEDDASNKQKKNSDEKKKTSKKKRSSTATAVTSTITSSQQQQPTLISNPIINQTSDSDSDVQIIPGPEIETIEIDDTPLVISDEDNEHTDNADGIQFMAKIELPTMELSEHFRQATEVADVQTPKEKNQVKKSSKVQNTKYSKGFEDSKNPYVCGFCINFSATQVNFVKAHHMKEHASDPFVVYLKSEHTKGVLERLKPSEPVQMELQHGIDDVPFDKYINYLCYHCHNKYNSIQELYKHWLNTHKESKISPNNITFPGRPFQYKVTKLVSCYYCGRSGTFNDIKLHCYRSHQDKSFATINMRTPDRCGECDFKYEINRMEILQHYKLDHSTSCTSQIRLEPIDYLNEQFFEKLLLKGYDDKRRCLYCEEVLLYKEDFDKHHAEKHPNLVVKYMSTKSPVEYGCPTCRESSTEELLMVKHIRTHCLLYQCKYCTKQYKHLKMVQQHHEIMHKKTDNTYRCVDVDSNMELFEKMRIFFPNGLILTKAEALYTKYGDIENIKIFLHTLNMEELESVTKIAELKMAKDAEAAANKTKTKSTKSNGSKSSKRRKSSTAVPDYESDKSDITSTSKSSTKSRDVRDRKSKINLKRILLTDSEEDDDKILKRPKNQSPSSEDEPLVKLIKPREPIDLTKVYTYMNIAGSDIKISIDRFAKIVNINPKVSINWISDVDTFVAQHRLSNRQ